MVLGDPCKRVTQPPKGLRTTGVETPHRVRHCSTPLLSQHLVCQGGLEVQSQPKIHDEACSGCMEGGVNKTSWPRDFPPAQLGVQNVFCRLRVESIPGAWKKKKCFCVTVFCAVSTVAVVPDTGGLYNGLHLVPRGWAGPPGPTGPGHHR